MRIERFCQQIVLFLFRSLQFLEECYECLRIVAGFIAIFQTQQVSFTLRVSREFQHGQRPRDVEHLACCESNGAAEQRQWDRRKVEEFSTSGVPGGMPGSDMGNLMRHQARKFGFIINLEQETGIDIHIAAR